MENLTKVLEAFKDLADSATKLHEQAKENVNDLENLLLIDLIKKGEYDNEWYFGFEDDGDTVDLAVGDYVITFHYFGDDYDNEFVCIFNGDEEIDPSAELQTLIEKL